MRVAHGSLPASFSRQCYEDFLDFKMRVIERLNQPLESQQVLDEQVEFRVITVEESGKPSIEEIFIERRSNDA